MLFQLSSLCSAPVVAMVWEGKDVVKTGRAIIGMHFFTVIPLAVLPCRLDMINPFCLSQETTIASTTGFKACKQCSNMKSVGQGPLFEKKHLSCCLSMCCAVWLHNLPALLLQSVAARGQQSVRHPPPHLPLPLFATRMRPRSEEWSSAYD